MFDFINACGPIAAPNQLSNHDLNISWPFVLQFDKVYFGEISWDTSMEANVNMPKIF